MVIPDHLTLLPLLRGKACIHGARIACADGLDYLGVGLKVEERRVAFPDLMAGDLPAGLTVAAGRERRFTVAA